MTTREQTFIDQADAQHPHCFIKVSVLLPERFHHGLKPDVAPSAPASCGILQSRDPSAVSLPESVIPSARLDTAFLQSSCCIY